MAVVTLEAAVEALARAMGWWGASGHPSLLQAGPTGLVLWASPTSSHVLTPHEAMLWLRCALLGTHADRPWAEVLIGAMPRECGACSEGVRSQTNPRTGDVDDFECIDCEDGTLPGDPEARTLLTQLSDQLQLASMAGLDLDSPAHAAELGVWLALYLGQQPCEARSCKDGQTPVKLGPSIQGHDGQVVYPIIETASCSRCAGSGLALGAHDRAMAEAGEQLAVGLEQAEAAE